MANPELLGADREGARAPRRRAWTAASGPPNRGSALELLDDGCLGAVLVMAAPGLGLNGKAVVERQPASRAGGRARRPPRAIEAQRTPASGAAAQPTSAGSLSVGPRRQWRVARRWAAVAGRTLSLSAGCSNPPCSVHPGPAPMAGIVEAQANAGRCCWRVDHRVDQADDGGTAVGAGQARVSQAGMPSASEPNCAAGTTTSARSLSMLAIRIGGRSSTRSPGGRGDR